MVKSFLWDGCANKAAPLGSSKVTDSVLTIDFLTTVDIGKNFFFSFVYFLGEWIWLVFYIILFGIKIIFYFVSCTWLLKCFSYYISYSFVSNFLDLCNVLHWHRYFFFWLNLIRSISKTSRLEYIFNALKDNGQFNFLFISLHHYNAWYICNV